MINLFGAQRFNDGDRIEIAGGTVRLKVSGRARRVSLRLDVARREVLAIAPSARRLAEAVAFARDQAAWIAARVAEMPGRPALAPGAEIAVLGRPCRLEHEPGRLRARLVAASAGAPARLIAGGEEEAYARSVVRCLTLEARRALAERTAVHAAALGQPMPVVSIMDARARWGSCKPPRAAGFGAAAEVGRIRYSWRLILSPFEVMDYVAAHECAHLIEANHSPAFWAVVRGLIGDERPQRAWLKANGAALHAFGV
ncbi:metal-dependent hydrolase [Caulobacter sp. CCUG 60055]|nr:M48 family metallopeptidase [Caulobacter sp. CCUG 60055]MBQ1543396.1 M48 family metallopeptidase [Caulobacteraceae bacterium]MCI3179708.1 metal-dependent hydrolase [Caulobacter sp. CCUG 60055]